MDIDLVERLRGAPVDGYGTLVALLDEAADRIEALQADKAKLREAASDGLDALNSARSFILKKYGSMNPAREDAIAALTAALQETGQ